MKLLRRPIVVLVVGITANATAVRADSASKVGERKVDVGEGVSLRVIEVGPAGPRPTLVFIPGWSTGADIWREQIDRFAPTYRVISFDPRSQGQSASAGSTRRQRLKSARCGSFGESPLIAIGAQRFHLSAQRDHSRRDSFIFFRDPINRSRYRALIDQAL